MKRVYYIGQVSVTNWNLRKRLTYISLDKTNLKRLSIRSSIYASKYHDPVTKNSTIFVQQLVQCTIYKSGFKNGKNVIDLSSFLQENNQSTSKRTLKKLITKGNKEFATDVICNIFIKN